MCNNDEMKKKVETIDDVEFETMKATINISEYMCYLEIKKKRMRQT